MHVDIFLVEVMKVFEGGEAGHFMGRTDGIVLSAVHGSKLHLGVVPVVLCGCSDLGLGFLTVATPEQGH